MSDNGANYKNLHPIRLNNLSCVRDEDFVVLDLTTSGNRHGKNVEKMIQDLKGKCTMAGATFGPLSSTYRDEDHPVLILTIKGRMPWGSDNMGKNVTTSFLIRREDLYLVGYCPHKEDVNMDYLRDPKHWHICVDDTFTLKGSQKAHFGVNYNSSNSSCKFIGKTLLLEKLYTLHQSARKTAHGAAFHSVCYYIAEATRFIPISSSIQYSFDHEGKFKVKSEESGLTDIWDKLGEGHLRNRLYHENCNMALLIKCGISQADNIPTVLRIMVRESDLSRKRRREGDQIEYGVKPVKVTRTYKKRQGNEMKAEVIDAECKRLLKAHRSKLHDKYKALEERREEDMSGRIDEKLREARINEIRCEDMWKELGRLMKMEDSRSFNLLFQHVDIIDPTGNLTRLVDDFNNKYETLTIRTYQ